MSEENQITKYIGERGYTILKEYIDEKELEWLRDKLSPKPYTPSSPIQPPSFKVYQESLKKIYIPRCFGVENYGEPDISKISKGESINISFNGELRDYQKNIVSIYLKSNKQSGTSSPVGLLEIPCGRGKTVIALNIISQLKTKTLVIVHKGFLLNQWVERIEQFLPGARIGKIQGQTIDIDNKDIVIGMIQSLAMKEYPQDMFSSFGLTIVDECHHISSEVFSKTLLKIVTRCMLGLSATMERKDGLTYVFKMFLGDIVYSEKRENDDPVLVKGIEFKSKNDSDFDETIYDYRGNPAFSSMITKICNYNHRSEFILKVLIKELEIKPDQQIMILAHNRNLLTYLYQAIETRKIATVGYYVGGMKEIELKKSETKKIIVATYSMAAEGLDIKTLSTLILATPKTDVVQAVGRILRVKHERPMIIDIIDTHDMFKKQWYKRRSYYLKSKYKVLYTNNDDYFIDKWKQTENKSRKKTKSSLNIDNDDNENDNQEDSDDTEESNQYYKTNNLFGKCLIKF